MILDQQLKRVKKSAVVVVSSIMGDHPCPCHIYYSCTKVFVKFLYDGLAVEASTDARLRDKIDF